MQSLDTGIARTMGAGTILTRSELIEMDGVTLRSPSLTDRDRSVPGSWGWKDATATTAMIVMVARAAAIVLIDVSHMVESTPRAMLWAVAETAPPVALPDFPKRRAEQARDSTVGLGQPRRRSRAATVSIASNPVDSETPRRVSR